MVPKVVIIGAGWAGLSAARTYTLVNPDADITILDDDTSVGGVWSASRLYPGLVADSPRGLFEYSDMSMLDEDTLDKKEMYGPLKGKETNHYLQRYAEKWDLVRRIRFQSKVIKAERHAQGDGLPTGWRITLASGDILDCDKLIVASGLYSEPSTPAIPDINSFVGFSVHSKLLGQHHHRLLNPNIKSITVIGGGKSAVETINLCLHLPNKPHIDWIIRGSDYGVPIIMNDPTSRFSLLALGTSRLFSSFSPSIYDTESWMYRWFHSGHNWLGTWLTTCFWKLLSLSIRRGTEYDKSEQGRMIKPKVQDLFQSLPHVCLIHNGNPVLDELHKGEQITVHVGELDHATSSGVVIIKRPSSFNAPEDKQKINADALVWCTGFKASTSFFSPSETVTLGLPMPLDAEPVANKNHWNDLLSVADTELLTVFPALRKFPLQAPKERTTNYRLYRQVLSPSSISANDHSIVFVGFVSNAQTAFASELTGLYGVAWLEGLLTQSDFPSQEDMDMDIARTHAWMARRYGAKGHSSPEVPIEIQTYFDVLVNDLGGKVHRKGGWGEYLGVYRAKDYSGLLEDVVERRKKMV
ncbi:FAD/NAD(P)-binding domain-containing protein [Pleomassaria siparia CBS 279.74]|uniref:FAD/NAD(P)-binding domain-containing protein n=1 Tax=Pleomassaria siparia CBS 279.74 TaxID=1314801 RepID=A0A6G1KSJ0_9PLEO|nr:FAD/NAD(P)-binding domain-containing protein [Pleomassaria siparia CBS 279.74]